MVPSVRPAPDVQTIAQAVDDRYNHLHTLQAEFAEIYRGAGMERTESGTLWLKKPGKMRWEYRSPREKLLDRKSTRLNSSHGYISYAVFCLKKKKKKKIR